MVTGCIAGYIEEVVTNHNLSVLICYYLDKNCFFSVIQNWLITEFCKFRGRKLRLLVMNVGKAVQNNIIGLIPIVTVR